MKQDIPLSFYYYTHLILWEASDRGLMKKNEAINYMGRFLTLKKEIRPVILAELELIGLVRTERRDYIRIKKSNLSKDSIVRKMYQKVKLF